ncbi:MAG TPA: carbohydrate porin [Gemmatimonadales bacterium]|nr:carbohydrate porin [Gemmatimonadales bacterium]
MLASSPLAAQDSTPRLFIPKLLGAQVTVIGQDLLRFQAPYTGPKSLIGSGDLKATDTYGIYFGDRLPAGFEVYLDFEMARGAGISNATGLAGITNGDVIRQGTANLGNGPYVARAFLRYSLALGPGTEANDRAQDQLPGPEPANRLEVDAGKFAVSDLFDVNRYANSTRTQFMDWGLFQNSAWDFAADTRGYTWGLAVSLVRPTWAVRLGSFAMPLMANGNVFDVFPRARGDNLEVTLQPGASGTVIRLLAYENHARMGVYADAIAHGIAVDSAPNIVADDRPGRTKTGLGINVEQPLADSGATGAFLRGGWNDGKNEDFAFTEVDRHLSFGGQVSGHHWGRNGDILAVALLIHGLSPDHRAYLAAGGVGFLLGDGRLNYGLENILEAYYRAQIGPYLEIGPDFQWIHNPGYNRDRGPAAVLSLRLNARY